MTQIADILRSVYAVRLYDDTGGSYGAAKTFAQRQLSGRTHFADDDSLRYFHSRIVKARVTENGVFFWLIECGALAFENKRRGYRYALFDVFGTCVARPEIADARPTKVGAEKAFLAFYNAFDGRMYYRKALDERAQRMEREAADSRAAARLLYTVETD